MSMERFITILFVSENKFYYILKISKESEGMSFTMESEDMSFMFFNREISQSWCLRTKSTVSHLWIFLLKLLLYNVKK